MNDDSGPLLCTRCHGEMQAGYIPDGKYDYIANLAWHHGAPKPAFFSGIKVSGDGKPVSAYRCTNCGHLDLFAK